MDLKLSAEIREKKEKLDKNHLAAVLYGKGQETLSLKIKYNEFVKLFEEAGESNLISLSLKGEEFPILVKDFQKDVLKDNYIHVDLYKVNMKEKVRAEIPLEFVGKAESKALRELGGIFIINMNELSSECLPNNLVDHIEIDLSSLNELGDVIRVEDIKLPAGIDVFHEGHEIVCVAEAPKKTEEKDELKDEGKEGEVEKEAEANKDNSSKEGKPEEKKS